MATLFQKNQSLQSYNTFGMEVCADNFAIFHNLEELIACLKSVQDQRLLILGGGSNVLFTKNFEGVVLKNECKGIEIVHEDADAIYVKAGAGESWHDFVQYCLHRDWNGLENLSLIPGTVGAAPIQNIGAYGVEMEQFFWNLEAWHIKESRLVNFTKNDCGFGYRDSVFKSNLKGQYVILNVIFRLPRVPQFHTSYGAISQELERMQVKKLSAHAISDAVINIRRSKLPDPKILGNAGSFFKNPLLSKSQFDQLKNIYPDIPGHLTEEGSVKVPAAWLIEKAGWKGFREGDAGCHNLQPLVLVNYGHATGQEIFQLSEKIIQHILSQFEVKLEREVNIID